MTDNKNQMRKTSDAYKKAHRQDFLENFIHEYKYILALVVIIILVTALLIFA